MRRLVSLLLLILLWQTTSFAQTPSVETGAAKNIQQSAVTSDTSSPPPVQAQEVKIPAGTPIEVEVAYTVSSIDLKPGERIRLRVLVPVMANGRTVIEKRALATARVTVARRGGHWGKAGRLAWSMEDVVAIDNTRIPLVAESSSRSEEIPKLKPKEKNSENAKVGSSVKGTSHGGEVATKTIIAAALFPPLAPLALMQGFRRGENAVLFQGRRFVVAVRGDTNVNVIATNNP